MGASLLIHSQVSTGGWLKGRIGAGERCVFGPSWKENVEYIHLPFQDSSLVLAQSVQGIIVLVAQRQGIAQIPGDAEREGERQ